MSLSLKKYCICITLILFQLSASFAQTNEVNQSNEVSKQNYFNRMLDNLTIGGYYRAFFYGRQMGIPYTDGTKNKTLAVVDPAYFDPMLFLYVGGKPTSTTSFGFDLNIINFMQGPLYSNSSGTPKTAINTNFLNNFQTSVLRGDAEIKGVGKFYLRFGGIEWTRLTGFTFGENIRYNRYSVFDRRPWDPGGNVMSRYGSYYYDGTFSQDVRFGTKAFKGILLNGLLAKNISFDFYYGKAATNGGTKPTDRALPKHDVALKLTKEFNPNGSISLNTYNSIMQTDSTNKDSLVKKQFNMVTVSGHYKNKYISFYSEAGIGGYESPTFSRKWSPAVVADLGISKLLFPVPLVFRGYYVGRNFVNLNSSIQNTTIGEATSSATGFSTSGAGILLPAGEQLTGVGDLVNNRVGGNVNTEIRVGNLKIQLGNEISTDIEKIAGNDTIYFNHRINGLQWSRFVPFPNPYGYFGPNKRVNTFYRGVYEKLGYNQLDANGNPIGKLKYNAADVQLKWHSHLFGRDLFIFNLNSLSSVGTSFAPIPRMTQKSFLHALYNEVEVYYQIHRILMIDFYGGLEHIKANNQTQPVVNKVTNEVNYRNERGQAIGTGFDLAVNSTTNIYFRYRWFSYRDKSQPDEKFKGREATIELKIFF